jgi:GT2 family glycosyltransferase
MSLRAAISSTPLTFVIPAKNDPSGMTRRCIDSAANSARMLGIPGAFVLVADKSDDQPAVLEIFASFSRQSPGTRVRAVRCKEWLHYTGVFAVGLSFVTVGHALFLSNDMIMTPHFLLAVLGVSGLAQNPGIVRGTSNMVDSHPEHCVASAATAHDEAKIMEQSQESFRRNGFHYVIDRQLSGDAVLVRRELIDAIGVLDTRFFGFFGDIDYGIRARRAGFNLVCAKGAWLYHMGGGHVVRDADISGTTAAHQFAARNRLARAAYTHFREKWGREAALPYAYGADTMATVGDCIDLLSRQIPNRAEYQPLENDLCSQFELVA